MKDRIQCSLFTGETWIINETAHDTEYSEKNGTTLFITNCGAFIVGFIHHILWISSVIFYFSRRFS